MQLDDFDSKTPSAFQASQQKAPNIQRGCRTVCLPLLILGSCMVGPDPNSLPDAPVPAAFGELEPNSVPSGPSTARWWESYGDPQLTDLVRTGIRANADVREAAARVAQARALLGLEESALYPDLDAVGGVTRVRGSETADPGGGITQNRFALGFGTAWEIDLWGRVRRSIDASAFDAQAAALLVADAQRSVAAEIAGEYIRLRNHQSQLTVLRLGIAVQERLQAITAALVTKGAASGAEAERVRARLERTRSAVPSLEAAVRVGVQRLSVLCALSSDEVDRRIANAGRLPTTPLHPDPTVPSLVLRDRPDVAAAAASLGAEIARLGVAEADLYPRITLTGDFGSAATDLRDLFDGESTAFGIGPSVRWPLLNFGRVRARIRAQGASQEAAWVRYEQAIRVAIAEVEMALAERRGALGTRDTLLRASEASTRAQQLAETRYQLGAEPLINALDAERERLEISAELVASQCRLLLADVALHRAIGSRREPAEH